MQPTSTPPRDFSAAKKVVQFTADGDTFYGVPRVATMLFANVVTKINTTSDNDLATKIEAVTEFFDICLIDESANLIKSRLRDKKNPIDVPQALDIVAYLAEAYGARPTPPSSSSSDGSATEETGTSSTAGAPSEVSIPSTSPLLGF